MLPPAQVPEEEAGGAGLRMLLLALAAVGWLAGTVMQLRQADLLAAPVAWAMLAGALSASIALALWAGRSALAVCGEGWRGRQVALAAIVGLLLFAAISFATTTLRAHARLAERLPVALEGRDILVTGLVAQLPRQNLQGTRFLFEVESARLEGQPVALPPLLSLGWYRGAEPDALLLGPDTAVRAGQRWRLTVRLRQPHGSFNPGGFDLELWLFERGIGATGSVRSSAGSVAELLDAEGGAPIERLRQRVRDAIERRLPDPADARMAGLLAALAIGDQAAIEREDWDLYRTTGVAHLMSISGLHVTMFAWMAGGAIGWLWRRSSRAMVRLPAPLAARWGGVAAALAYALVAGWGVPAQRTVWMLAAVALLQSLGRRWPLHLVLLAVAAVVVAADPWAMLQPGFWLSFVAVAMLAASDPGRAEEALAEAPEADRASHSAWLAARARRAWSVARAALRTQAIATVGLAPLTLVFFQQISIVGFVANLVAIPVVTLLVTPLALAGVLVPPLWSLAAGAAAALNWVLQGLASWPAAVWQSAAAPAWAMAAGLLGGLVAVLPLPWQLRAMALPLMLPLLVPPLPRPAVGAFEVVALDIGQGTAALVRTRQHLLVYDTGPAFSPDSDAGSRMLVPLLRWRGERHVDHLVLSHRDTDHVGGAGSLLAALPVRAVSSSLAEEHPLVGRARAAGASLQRCEAGQHWTWDGVTFEILHPGPADYGRPGLRPNALSCVLRVEGARAGTSASAVAAAGRDAGAGASTSVLLTGDIEAPQEAALVAAQAVARAAAQAAGQSPGNPAILRSRLLLVPHHGSRTSSTPAFIEAVAPELALAQAGYRSRFGHPAADIVARYESRGIALLRSDRCGALTVNADGSTRCEREAARRYWHHRAGHEVP